MKYEVTKEHSHSLDFKILKAYLRISYDYDDELLQKLCQIAISNAESFLRYSITVKNVKVNFLKEEYKSKIRLPIMYADNILSVLYILNDKENKIMFEDSFSFFQEKNLVELNSSKKYKEVEICYQTKNIINSNVDIHQGILIHIEYLYEKKSNNSILNYLHQFYHPYRRILL